MQISMLEVLEDTWNYKDKNVLIGLSGGINSAAVLAYLAKNVKYKPNKLHLFYAHFDEHSDDTMQFVIDCAKYAFKQFANEEMPIVDDTSSNIHVEAKNNKVVFHMTNNSVNAFFRKSKMIPHPSISPCTRLLKILPMAEYMHKHNIYCDLVGYVKTEKQRITKQQQRLRKKKERTDSKQYIISHYTDEDCFSLVKSEIGWYPNIYDLRWSNAGLKNFLIEKGNINRIPDGKDSDGNKILKNDGSPVKNQRAIVLKLLRTNKRIYSHNNCLMCKNWQSWEQIISEYFFPKKVANAQSVANELGAHWGRDTDKLDFGQTTCTFCEF